MEIIQRKSKDAELAAPIYCQLESVEIPGWFDEDGEAVTSAVIKVVDVPARKLASPVEKHRRLFETAWEPTNKEVRNNAPYISRSGFKAFLIDTLDINPKSADVYVKPSQKGRVICELLKAGMIQNFEHGWVVTDPAWASAMMLGAGTE
jgi:hypothetical protein